MKSKNNGFTLIELIIVITILAILWTISFIAFLWYTKNARDSVRISDINSMIKSLEIYHIMIWEFPDPSNKYSITYSGSLVWNQGTFWDSVFTNVRELSKKPIDPLTGNEYTYSLTNTKQEFQIAAMYEWNLISFSNILYPQAYADNNWKTKSIVKGNYNWKFIKTEVSWTNYILGVPSIITSEITSVDIENILNNKTFVFSWYQNLPSSYKDSWYTMTGGFDFSPTRSIILYQWDVSQLWTQTGKLSFADNIDKYYTNTTLSWEPDFKEIIDIDITNNEEWAVNLITSFLQKNLWGIYSNIISSNQSPQTETITFQSDIYTLWDEQLKQIFATGWVYTENWSTNTCNLSNLTIDTTTFVWWTQSINPMSLSANTIYKIPNGSYNIIGTSDSNGHIKFWWNCIALIWQSRNGVIFQNNLSWGGAKYNTWIFFINDVKNIIVSWISVDGYKDNTNKYWYNIYFRSSSNNAQIASTVNNVKTYNSYSYGLYFYNSWNTTSNNIIVYDSGIMFWNAGNNILSNIETYSNTNGIRFSSSSSWNNKLSNIKSYNNTWGLQIDSWANRNLIQNIEIYNSRFGIELSSSSQNVVNNAQIYNNNDWWLTLSYNSNNNIFNNIQIYNNNTAWINFSSAYPSNNNSFNNVQSYNNVSWVNIASWSSTWNKYYWNFAIFWNTTNILWTTWNDSLLSPWVSTQNIPSASQFASSINFWDWTLNTTWTMVCTYHTQPNLLISWGINCSDKGQKYSWLTLPVTSYNYWINISKQIQPIKFNTTNSLFELYGINNNEYSTSEFIGQW